MNTYWIKATGSACYNNFGMTHPIKSRIRWHTLPVQYRWVSRGALVPDVIAFDGNELDKANVERFIRLTGHQNFLIVVSSNYMITE